MSAGAAGAAAAMIAAQHEEEESLTGYSQSDLADGWEFKILRSSTGAFRNPARMREALEQEARAGWVLVEKFDNSRLRLKRPASARAGDSTLEFDPHRTTYGMRPEVLAITIVLSVLFVGAAIVTIALLRPHP